MLLKFIDGHFVERIRLREFMEIITCSSPLFVLRKPPKSVLTILCIFDAGNKN
jgi:hypothetical protein